MTEPLGPELVPFPIQLIAAFCVQARCARKPKPAERGTDPDFTVTLARTELNEAGTDFSCRLTVAATIPVGAVLTDCRVVVQGDFRSQTPIESELVERFAAYTPTVLLWPYARGYLGDLGRMLAVPLPPLPTLDTMPIKQESAAGDGD